MLLTPNAMGPRLRIEGERVGLPGPALTPYLYSTWGSEDETDPEAWSDVDAHHIIKVKVQPFAGEVHDVVPAAAQHDRRKHEDPHHPRS